MGWPSWEGNDESTWLQYAWGGGGGASTSTTNSSKSNHTVYAMEESTHGSGQAVGSYAGCCVLGIDNNFNAQYESPEEKGAFCGGNFFRT